MTLTDAESLERFRAGDNDAFRVIVERYQKRLHAFLARYFNLPHGAQGAENVARDTFYRLYGHLMRNPDFCLREGSLQPLLVRIAEAAAIDELRHESLRASTYNEMLLFPPPDLYRPDWSARIAQIRIDVERAMGNVPPDLQTIGILHLRDGHTCPEVAEITGLAETTVKHRIRRVRQLLVNQLQDYV